jgi:hypothetical protein
MSYVCTLYIGTDVEQGRMKLNCEVGGKSGSHAHVCQLCVREHVQLGGWRVLCACVHAELSIISLSQVDVRSVVFLGPGFLEVCFCVRRCDDGVH